MLRTIMTGYKRQKERSLSIGLIINFMVVNQVQDLLPKLPVSESFRDQKSLRAKLVSNVLEL